MPVEILPEVDKVPIDPPLSFVKGTAYIRVLSAEEGRQIEALFPHWNESAGPRKAGRLHDSKHDEYGDELIARSIVDEDGKPLWPTRDLVAKLGARRHAEVTRRVVAFMNADESQELRTLRGLWALALEYVGDDNERDLVAGDFWDEVKAYVERAEAAKNSLAPAN
jgi:hypothetical protein